VNPEPKPHRAGFVSIIGKPNVGKSTLMNVLVGERLSIITSKAQTTRHRIMGILNGDDFQLVYSDTPGIIQPKYELHNAMMSFVYSSLEDADVILFQEALQHHHIEHQLHVVPDGQSALNFVARMGTTPEAPCPDVMLLDLNLPKVDGPTILEEFRKHPECAHTPVIVVTSSDAETDRAKVAAFKVARYFRKPSDFDAFMELGAIVKEVVEGQTA
jgi:CheY-like chemotaxis protein